MVARGFGCDGAKEKAWTLFDSVVLKIMSVVGMRKRPLDEMNGLHDALPATCSSACSSRNFSMMEFLGKRARYSDMCAASSRAAGVPSKIYDSVFPTPAPLDPAELDAIVESLSPSKCCKFSIQDKVQGKAQKMYSHQDVIDIVSKVTAQRESQLRLEYEEILTAKLNEQFNSFTRFNQDHISRMVQGNTFSYVS